MIKPGLVIIAALYGYFSLAAVAEPVNGATENAWRQVAPGLEITEINLSKISPLGGQLVLARAVTTRHRLEVIRAAQFGWQRATAKTLCKAARASVCVNANFFDESGNPLGLVVSRGTEYSRLHRGGRTLTGIMQLTRQEISVLNRSDFMPGRAIEAIQAGPRLLKSGLPIPGLKDSRSTRRAGMCLDQQGRVIFYCSHSTLSNLSVSELQTILQNQPVSCLDALNLDGGGSAQMFIAANPARPLDSKTQGEVWLSGRDEVPIALGLFAEPPSPQ